MIIGASWGACLIFRTRLCFLDYKIMKRMIKNILNTMNEVEYQLYKEVCNLENDMNECECLKRVKHDFRNQVSINEIHILCLNCGGYIEYNEDDWR